VQATCNVYRTCEDECDESKEDVAEQHDENGQDDVGEVRPRNSLGRGRCVFALRRSVEVLHLACDDPSPSVARATTTVTRRQ